MTFAYESVFYWMLVALLSFGFGFLTGWAWSQKRYRELEKRRLEKWERKFSDLYGKEYGGYDRTGRGT